MQNQQNNELEGLRTQIDDIDRQLIALFSKRMDVVNKVGKLKKSNKEKFFIRSNREADMIRNLVKEGQDSFCKSSIISIWRKIITNANMAEQPLTIAIHNPNNICGYEYLVKSYYNEEVPINNFDSATSLISEIEKGKAKIGVFILPKSGNDNIKEDWWINLANNNNGLRVFARIPFIEYEDDKKNQDQVNLVAVAIKNAEKSEDDISLLSIELKSEFSKSKLISLIEKHKIKGKIIKSAKQPQINDIDFYLFEADGFYNNDDEVINEISKNEIKPYIRVIGHYARPILI